jgi:hypothetical protein
MQRPFRFLSLAAAALSLWFLFVDPATNLQSGGKALLSGPLNSYSAWAMGVLMGLALAWLATADWSKLSAWILLQRGRLGLLILGALLASLLYALR